VTLALWLVLASCPAAEGLTLEPAQAATLCALAEQRAPTTATALSPESLQAVYARDEFKRAHQTQRADLLRRLRALLSKLFETSGAETYSNATRVAVLVLAALLIVAVVARLAGRRLARRAVDAPAAAERPLVLEDPSVHLAEAERLVTNDPRAGAREGLLAMLAALERQRLARPDRVKTNRELARELPERGAPAALAEAVRAQLEWFDRAFYSLEPLELAGARAFLERARAVVAQVAAFAAEPNR